MMTCASKRFVHTLSAAIYLLLFLAPAPASALSCYGLKDHVFLSCTLGTCRGEFRAKEIHGAGACGRRTVVEAVPDDVVRVIMTQLKLQSPSAPLNGLVQVTIVHRFYADPPSNADDWARELVGQNHRVPTLEVQNRDKNTSISRLKTEWQTRARNEGIQTVIYRVIDWGILAGALILAFKSTLTYRTNLLAHRRGQRTNLGMIKPLISQVILFAITAFVALLTLEFPLVVLVAPLILLIWIYEFAIFGLLWFRSVREAKKEH